MTLLSLPSSSFISSLSVTAHSWTSGPPSESRSGEAPGLRPTSLRMSTSGAPASCYLTGAALPPSPRPSCISPQTPAAPAPAPAEPQESHFPWRQHPARTRRTAHVHFPLLGLRCRQRDICGSHSASAGFSVRNSLWRKRSQPMWWVPERRASLPVLPDAPPFRQQNPPVPRCVS